MKENPLENSFQSNLVYAGSKPPVYDMGGRVMNPRGMSPKQRNLRRSQHGGGMTPNNRNSAYGVSGYGGGRYAQNTPYLANGGLGNSSVGMNGGQGSSSQKAHSEDIWKLFEEELLNAPSSSSKNGRLDGPLTNYVYKWDAIEKRYKCLKEASLLMSGRVDRRELVQFLHNLNAIPGVDPRQKYKAWYWMGLIFFLAVSAILLLLFFFHNRLLGVQTSGISTVRILYLVAIFVIGLPGAIFCIYLIATAKSKHNAQLIQRRRRIESYIAQVNSTIENRGLRWTLSPQASWMVLDTAYNQGVDMNKVAAALHRKAGELAGYDGGNQEDGDNYRGGMMDSNLNSSNGNNNHGSLNQFDREFLRELELNEQRKKARIGSPTHHQSLIDDDEEEKARRERRRRLRRLRQAGDNPYYIGEVGDEESGKKKNPRLIGSGILDQFTMDGGQGGLDGGQSEFQHYPRKKSSSSSKHRKRRNSPAPKYPLRDRRSERGSDPALNSLGPNRGSRSNSRRRKKSEKNRNNRNYFMTEEMRGKRNVDSRDYSPHPKSYRIEPDTQNSGQGVGLHPEFQKRKKAQYEMEQMMSAASGQSYQTENGFMQSNYQRSGKNKNSDSRNQTGRNGQFGRSSRFRDMQPSEQRSSPKIRSGQNTSNNSERFGLRNQSTFGSRGKNRAKEKLNSPRKYSEVKPSIPYSINPHETLNNTNMGTGRNPSPGSQISARRSLERQPVTQESAADLALRKFLDPGKQKKRTLNEFLKNGARGLRRSNKTEGANEMSFDSYNANVYGRPNTGANETLSGRFGGGGKSYLKGEPDRSRDKVPGMPY